jgi:RimJ/RimL family protein N-acetyltransferase
MKNIFQGELVRLSGDSVQTIAEAFSRWNRDSEYVRLLDNDPPRLQSVKSTKTWLEKEMAEGKIPYFFTIRTLSDDRLIGFIGLFGIEWNNGSAWVGIGLGEREYWGKGYGTDAMRLAMRYAFDELNLHRVSLGVFEYNPRAVRAYEKAGFKLEGRGRQMLHRDGKRADILFMGLLHDEWKDMKGKLYSNG